MGYDRHPIRALGEFPLPEIFTYDQQVSFLSENEQLKRPDFDTIHE